MRGNRRSFIKMATLEGGEEEFGLHAFRYLVGNDVFQIVQPDLFYFGGMIRTSDANGTLIPVESKAEKFESIEGVIWVPS